LPAVGKRQIRRRFGTFGSNETMDHAALSHREPRPDRRHVGRLVGSERPTFFQQRPLNHSQGARQTRSFTFVALRHITRVMVN
jgi:hypothetical protein